MKALKKILLFLVNWVWQLPQNLLGLCYYSMVKKSISETLQPYKAGYSIYLKESKGGVSLGKYIFVPVDSCNLHFLIQHEAGHNRQSRMLGPLYLLVIGIPSFLWALVHRRWFSEKDYYWFYTESWANKLANLKR